MTANQSYNVTQLPGDYFHGPDVDHGELKVITFVVVLIIVMVIAIGGNILVLTTLALHKGMRTSTNLLLANLAVADIFVGVTNIPIAIITLINGG